uniref:ATP-binding protein n=1 Tax=Frankia sp. Cas3 TaxID=3073926 RepID=UPI002AD1F18E
MTAKRSRDSRLVPDLTSFVGRRRELSEARRLLSVSRLLTLTGPGGVGKTRLAFRLTGERWRAFPDGVWAVELAELDDPELLAYTVIRALGLLDRSNRSVQATLVDHLASRHLLLVLDNCEHLVNSCAQLADAMLRSCPDLRILATSRQPLGVAGEQVLVVPPLSVPNVDQRLSGEGLTHYDAVRLFVDRAVAVRSGFALTEGNGAAVAGLCQRLDGVPLAIELAAAWLSVMSPAQVLERLGDQIRLLVHGSRSAPKRQRTLRALIEWSFSLCSTEEQRVWADLSVCVGGFDLHAAEEICASGTVTSGDVANLVRGLVNKSVLVTEEYEGAVRYRMLETVRQYGRDRLQESGRMVAVLERHRS